MATTFLLSLIERLAPQGGAKKILRFSAGLLLVLVLFRPMLHSTGVQTFSSRQDYTREIKNLTEQYENENKTRMETLIAEKTASYIETRAQETGYACTALVTYTRGGDDALLQIETVTLSGEKNASFTSLIAAELGLTEEMIQWKEQES